MCLKNFEYCELPPTPKEFDFEKFKSGDEEQKKLYNLGKVPRRKKKLSYDEVMDEDKWPNYARVVPEDCVFIDFDDPKEADEMYEIITRAKSNCLILETTKGYHFLYRKPDFYKKEMTRATNWFGYKFDTKGPGAVQIIRVCGMDREERCSWDPAEPIAPASINIEKLDVLPYWLWGKLSDKDLHKKGKTGDRSKDDAVEYTLKDNPFTQLMEMTEGSRHNHIVERCSYFGLSNGFTESEFRDLISAIHDQYLVKIGTPMPDSDLFGDLDTRWADYKDMLEREGWDYEEKDRKWKKVKEKKEEKIDERRSAEWLYTQYDFYVTDKNEDGTYSKLLHRNKDGNYEYRNNVPERKQKLKEYSDQNFKETYFKEVEAQLMQLCIENDKIIARNDKYVIAKNKVMSCIIPDVYDFSWLGTRPPTDVVLPFNWYSEDWVDEHKEDLGGLIKNFIKELARDSSGKTQPEVEQWLYIIAGASMIPGNQLQKIVVMAGGGQNGKSLYTSLIKLCLGADMFNESKIFDNSNDSFWGKDLDKGICCIVDDMPRTYNRDALTNIKGAITGTDTVEINEKHKPKKTLAILPQIIACTNFEFELYDKSEGMKRRLLLLPTEFHIDDDIKDRDLEFKLVLNTTDPVEIAKYKMSADAFSTKGKKCMYMYTDEKGVLDSLDNGSLAWFANYCRYMYFKWLTKEIVPEESEKMKLLFKPAFDDSPKKQCEEFMNWHLMNKCGSTDNKVADLSPANGFYYELYLIYKEEFCKLKKLTLMEESIFTNNFARVVRKSFTVKKKKNNKGISLPYIYFNKPAKHCKKK